jgi:hypothetical protein
VRCAVGPGRREPPHPRCRGELPKRLRVHPCTVGCWRNQTATHSRQQRRLAALTYYSLGADAEADSRGYLRHYYGFLGEYAETIADSALRSEAAVAESVDAFEQVGITELYFDPATSSLDQVDRLADVVL